MNSGSLNDLDIHPRIVSAAKKAGYTNSWALLQASVREVKTKTGLTPSEAERLVKAAAKECSPSFVTAWEIMQERSNLSADTPTSYIKTGCSNLDTILRGGIPCTGLTELAGESGTGKTQMALQLAIQCQLTVDAGGLGKGVAYICTETQFPVSRLNQLISFRSNVKSFNGKPFSDNIYVHHLPDMDNLVDCVRYQLPQFVSKKDVGLVIIDSVAAVFRASEEKQEIKSKSVQQLGYRLRQLADKQGVAIISINQVTASMGGPNIHGMVEESSVPALGLSWANLVTTRLMLRKTCFKTRLDSNTHKTPTDVEDLSKSSKNLELRDPELRVRTLDILFCPWLPRANSPFTVTKEGIVDVHHSSMSLNL